MHRLVLQILLSAALTFAPFQALAAAPTATTTAATSITTSSAELNGDGDPGSEATTGWFRISSTDPGTCDDTFGTRIPAAGGTDLGAGSSSVPYSITATGLSSGVTYYFCAIVQNASGTAFGAVLSFTVPGTPAVTTGVATDITSGGATLEGTATPNAATTTGWFRYDDIDPGTCNDTFGTRAPTSGGSSLGSGSAPVAYSRTVSGLDPGKTYYYCAIAQNAHGTSFGTILTFTTLPDPPSVTTNAATLVTGTSAQLNGSVNPGGAPTTGWFRYSTTNPGVCDDTFGTRAPTTGGSDLGDGSSFVAYGVGVTGLSSATTYYFCAIAQNSEGKDYGALRTFTTPSPPEVTTTAATNIASTSARLNGSANPRGAATTGWFRYSFTNPGTCDDTFGSRAPATGGTSLGAGSSTVSYSRNISGLSAGTTYYYCAIAQNSEGLSFGAIMSFVTAAAPTVTTTAATSITSSSATLNGDASPNSSSSYGYFRYSTTDPGTCNDSFGTREPTFSSSDTFLGTGSSPVSYSRSISSLSPGTTYYFCAIARNSYGTSFGAILSFATEPAQPTVSTNNASNLTGTGAQLNGSGNPGGDATTGWFRYATTSPGTCNDSFGTRAPATGGSALGAGTSSVGFSESITGLTPATVYYFCAIAENSVGKGFGSVRSFTTPSPPVATTLPATSITNSSARLYGSGDPNGATTTGWFRYSTTDPGTCNDTFGSRAPAAGGSSLGSGSSPVNYNRSIAGLSPGTVYYFCAIVSSAEGTAFGDVLSFTTADAPSVTTDPATSVTSYNATLNGTGVPNGQSSYGYFRYDTTNPGTCSDGFGTRAPTSSSYDTYLGADDTSTPFARSISGLEPGTTYYFCAIARNSYGTTYGAILSFATPVAAPSAITQNASMLTGTGAQLNGTSDPGGAATTGWFRYDTTSPGTCNDTFGTRTPTTGGTDLGAGTSNVNFEEAITGLTPATTYYFCAIAENSVGKSFGSLRSFTTPLPPTVTTTAASSINNTSVRLNGTSDPNGSSTTGWFRYSLTDPMTCNDTFGSRAPTSGGSSLGSGTSPVNFNRTVSGLSPGTTYYYCAIASSAEGLGFGEVLTVRTADAPTVTTLAATSVSSSSATLNGDANPNNRTSYGYFRYGTTDPGTCSDSFGTRAPTSTSYDTNLGAGDTAVSYARSVSGLDPGTTYYFCAAARNSYGTTFGAVLTLTTAIALPSVTTNNASMLTGTGAQLNGAADPGGDSTTGWFRYGTASPGTCNDSFGTRAPATGGTDLGDGVTSESYVEAITGLTAGTTYYYCAIAENGVGLSVGSVRTFTTPLPPVAVTTAADGITSTSARLNGTGTPNGATTTGWFRYSFNDPGMCNDTFGSRAPTTGGTSLSSGSSPISYARNISGLSQGTTYYYCAIVSSTEGTAFGEVLTFTTADAPDVTTAAATSVTGTSATLNGDAVPNNNTSYGYYRYDTTDPGACNDSFGLRAPTNSYYDTNLGSGDMSVAYARSISSLQPGTTYYYCALARNSYGTSFGALLTFTTPAALPTAITDAASMLTGTTAQLNGRSDPGGAATTAWFRYDTTSPGTCNDTFGTRAPTTGGSDVGDGTSNVNFAETITGLTPATTYYFCAIAENVVGKTLGSIRSFTSPSPPEATTEPAQYITDTSARLYGTGDPNGSTATGWFRYSLTDPITCNDTFGSRAPTSGGSSLSSGSSPVNFNRTISGLSAGTIYYYCAIVSSAEGMSFGEVRTFSSADAPTVNTLAATSVTGTSAVLNGDAIPNNSTSYGYFRYSTTNPGACSDSFGARVPSNSYYDTNLGSGTVGVPYARSISSLTPGTTYFYCAIARNSYGTTYGPLLSLTTDADDPTVTTLNATGVVSDTATLNGSARANGEATTGWFRYGTASPGTCNDTFGTRAPTTGGAPLGAGSSTVSYSNTVTGLTPGVTYYFCAIAENAVGKSFGSVRSFTTPSPPDVSTLAATPVTAETATLNASINPNGYSTNGWFRYDTIDPGTCNTTFGMASITLPLGSGTSAVPLAEPLTGLSPATTYYFCAIGQSSTGTTLGAVLSFTTPAAPPSVTTVAATDVLNTSATLRGTTNPNGSSTTGWFRYSTANPGTCNDTFGTRLPTTGGVDLGAGNSPVDYPLSASSLTPGTTYYVCALSSSAIGNGVGAVLSFTTGDAPTVTSDPATLVTSTSATVNGTADSNQNATTGWFRYSTTSPGTCDDTFGTRAPATGGTAIGAGAGATAFAEPIAGLASGTTYYYCAIADNAIGTSFGAVLSFTTPTAPAVVSSPATAVSGTGATLNGSANPNLQSTTGWFRYSTADPGTCNDSFGTRAPSSGGVALGAGATPSPYAQAISGLSVGTTYYYCAIAQNSSGTSFGAVLSFTTSSAPTVASDPATLVTSSSATLGGSAIPNLDATTGWFRYSVSNPGTCNDSFGTRTPSSGGVALGAGTSAVPYTQPVSSLAVGTTYYYCAIAQNSNGTGFGAIQSLTTSAGPSAVTDVVAAVTSTSATLAGSANPNFDATTGWFRYDVVDPGTCDDSFGTRAPATGGTTLGAGASSIPYTEIITGLTAETTYYYCAIAENSVGTDFGAVLSFTTPSAPAVTSDPATDVAATSATLRGSANPNRDATTGWFRYSTTDPVMCNDSFGTRAPATGGTSLGNGATPVAYSEPLAGLTPGTTYYFCAIAQNAVDTGFGSVLSFTTPATPTVTSAPAAPVTSTGATLNGSANPNLDAATGWFRYAATDPGTCDDSFGTRVPATGGTALGASGSAVPFAEAITGLTPGATYYFCAIAESGTGVGFGSVLSFTATAAPTVTSAPASFVTSNSATLNGSGNPNLDATTGWFRYDVVDPGTCNDTFGTRAPTIGGTDLGAGGSAVGFSEAVTGLSAGTTYYVCAIGQNSVGMSFGDVLSFTTADAPSVVSQPPTAVTSTGATLNGAALPNLDATTGWFRYSETDPGACNDTFGTRAPVLGGTALGTGSSAVPFAEAIAGLSAGTTYYFCAIAENSVGTGFGNVFSFTTPGAPDVTSLPAASVSSTGATLGGAADPNLNATTGWFRYSEINPGTCDDSFGTRAPASGGTDLGAGASAVPYTQPITGLAAGTTYYFCAIADNAVGTRFGAVLSFTTTDGPSVASQPATAVTSTGATLSGAGDPNLAAATGWFRYSTADPGACDDSFGIRAPVTGGTALGAGDSAVPFSETIAGLDPGTTYYYCAIADNAAGQGFGAVLSFKTLAAPFVTSEPATAVTSTGATVNGSGDPNLAAAVGWFRYSETDPGTCSDSFGTRLPASGSTSLGAGDTAVAYSESVAGLIPGTTYYFCAIADNVVGTSFGSVLSFVTPDVPTVTSQPATDVTETSATLRGVATPNLDAATGWFRYSETDPGSCYDGFGTRVPTTGGTALGAGTSPIAYSEAIAGLMQGTTYYYCAIAENGNGSGFGAVLTFTTPDAPSVTTELPSMLTSASAQLNATADPRLADATGWFRYSAVDPGVCDDTFGIRAPATGGTVLAAGAGTQPYAEPISGLTPTTTYYYCAITANAVGQSYGAVVAFTAPTAPAVTTEDATDVASTTATINGTANPNLLETEGYFRYDLVDPGTCDDTFGTRVPTAGGTALGSGNSAEPFSEALADLIPGTTYYFCAIATNLDGTSFGDVLSLTTESDYPTVMTDPPTNVQATGADLNGSANPNGTETTGWFRYSNVDPGDCNDSFGVRVPDSGGMMLGSGTDAVAYAQVVMDLVPGEMYYYCAIADNAQGLGFGEILTFVTGVDPPTVITEDVIDIQTASAVLAGSGNPNGAATTGWFRLGEYDPGLCDDSFGVRVPETGGVDIGAGSEPVPYSQQALELQPLTTYYYCAAASNMGGALFGDVRSFTTLAGGPEVDTLVPTQESAGEVTLNGRVNPMGRETVAWFRYSTTEPAACDDSFGTRVPAVDGTLVPAGMDPVEFTEHVVGLTPGTTYYYCSVASNSAGVSFGEVLLFDAREGEDIDGCNCRVAPGHRGYPGTGTGILALFCFVLLGYRRWRMRE